MTARAARHSIQRVILGAALLVQAPPVALALPRDAVAADAGPAVPARDTVRVRAQANDLRTPAGRMVGGELHVELEAVEAEWHPRGPDGPAVTTPVFAEAGRPPQVPGPLIRVSAGTPVRVVIRNTLERPVHVRGLTDRVRPTAPPPGALAFLPAFAFVAPLVVAPGETQEVRFTPTAGVSTFYFGRLQPLPGAPAPPTIVPGGIAHEGAFMGALVVDPPAERAAADERILMLTRWGSPAEPGSINRSWKMFVNGQSWPFTERLEYAVGDTVRWRIINASGVSHPMHLHGFYFTVDGVGDTQRDSVIASGERRDAVTGMMAEYASMRVRWTPDRPGNWLFHCHLIRHSGELQRFQVERAGDGSPHAGHTADATDSHDMEGMAGLILGITVRSDAVERDPAPVRRIALWTGTQSDDRGVVQELGFVLQQGAVPPAPDSTVVPGSTIVLTRGEPTEIVVHNRLHFPLSVHWHGLEVRSLYDGVGHWSGTPGAVRPPIQPGDSQSVVIAAPRAGTFFYHTHGEPGHELAQGLYGALLVLEPGATPDPDADRIFVLGSRGVDIDAPPAINGRALPPAQRFERGRTYRLRFIHISPDEFKRVRLLRDSAVATWRARARDGADLPAPQRVSVPAEVGVGVGEAYDFEWTPERDGVYVLEVRTDYYPSRGGSAVQRIAFGVGDVPDGDLRRAAHGYVRPVELTPRRIARYRGTYAGTSGAGAGAVLSVWAEEDRLYFATSVRGGPEDDVSYIVPLAADLFAPAVWSDGFVNRVADDVRLRFVGPDSVDLVRAGRATRFVRSDPFVLTPDELRALAGTYGGAPLPTDIQVSTDGTGLSLTIAGQRAMLHPVSTSRFRLSGDDVPTGASVVFTLDDGVATALTVFLPAAPPILVPRHDTPREDTR